MPIYIAVKWLPGFYYDSHVNVVMLKLKVYYLDGLVMFGGCLVAGMFGGAESFHDNLIHLIH